MGYRLGRIQQVAFKCRVLLSAGEEGTLASPVGEILLFLSLPPYQSSPKWASVPIEYTAGGYEMVPSLGRFRPPVACGGQRFSFFVVNLYSERFGFFSLRKCWVT